MTELRQTGRYFVRISIAAAVLAAANCGAAAQPAAQVERAWRDWMTRQQLKVGGIAVVQGGQVVREAAIGSLQPGTPIRMASLSKAVTGVCIARLVERGTLSFDTPLGQALAKTFARVGSPADKRLLAATIGQTLVHRAGFGNVSGDPTTSTGLGDYLRRNSAKDTAFDAQVKWTIARPLAFAPGERYAYTNSAYLLLGAAIEEATGSKYEPYCRDNALTPLGAGRAVLNPNLRFMSSYGGWSMPLADYARFYQAFAPGNPAIGPKARTWMMSADGKSLGGGAHYGLGTDVRPAGGDANFWHWGSWRYNLSDAYDGPMADSWNSYAVRIGSADANATVYFEPQVSEGSARSELDRVLAQALAALRH